MNDSDVIPFRDAGYSSTNKRMKTEDADTAQRAAQQRSMVTRWERGDLEDKYLRSYEENYQLKKHARKQEDKIKRMATKLLRLVSDKKKSEQDHGVKKVRDIETEEMLEELHAKLRDYEKQNNQLKEKLMVTKQQLKTQGTRKSPYPHVQARINTGIAHAPADLRVQRSLRVQGPPSSRVAQSPGLPRYGHSVLEDTRAENRHLENIIQQLHEKLNLYEQDIEMQREQMRVRETEYEEDILKIKQQLSQGQRTNIQENIDVIRLQREVKDKSTKLSQIQAQFQNVEEKLHTVKTSHDQVLYEMDLLNNQLKEEQDRSMSLQNELKASSLSQRALVEYQERVADLERECEILKEANEKLVTSAFDLEREREWRQREGALKVQVAQLEATLKADVGEKGSILDKLTSERDNYDELQEEHRDMRIKYFQLKQEFDDLKDKMSFFTKESVVDFQEIEEALMLVKQRKEKANQDLDFLEKVDHLKNEDYEKMVKEMQVEHADTINELEKTRNMLIVQHKINKDYQVEVEAVTRKMDENRLEFETRLQEFAQLLDIRAARIRKLEAQLRDVAYGTKQYTIKPAHDEILGAEEVNEHVELENGQNLFEIHVRRVQLNPDALKHLGDEEPSVFCTWEFFEYEIQSTPVMKGPKIDFEFTSQYIVKVDDFLLHYLQKESCTLELHQSFGTDYNTVGACQLNLREILDRSHGRVHGTANLIGVSGDNTGVNFGLVEYWVRLRVPMEQAMRLYKERSKALGYIDSNTRNTDQALKALDEDAAKRPPDNVNQLMISIKRCSNLQTRREGVQPSAYCVYKFFDFPEHDTSIIPGSNTPLFNDHKIYPLPMTLDLDKYLKSSTLNVYIFDDTDADDSSYLGLVKVPLIPLAHDKPVKGSFELLHKDGSSNGTIDLSLKWQFAYMPPKASTKTLAQLQAANHEEPEAVHLLPGEEEALKSVPPPSRSGRPPLPMAAPKKAELPPKTPQEQPQPVAPEDLPTHDELPLGEEEPKRASPIADDPPSELSEGTPVPVKPVPLPRKNSFRSTSFAFSANHKPEELGQTWPPKGQRSKKRSSKAKAELEHKTPEELIAEELKENLESIVEEKEKMSDTMFEDLNSEILQEEDESEIEEEALQSDRSRRAEETGAETEDSEVVVVATPSSRPQSASASNNPGDTVTVIVGEVTLNDAAPFLANDKYKMLYIEYRFLGVPLEETETPYSLPKPPPFRAISFNFTKVFHIDYDNYYERRQYLASMLLPDDPDQGRIKFTIVSEPDNDNEDCEDVGMAFVSVRDIMNSERDVEDTDVPIYDIHDDQMEIGQLKVTVRVLEALRAVQREMQLEKSSSISMSHES